MRQNGPMSNFDLYGVDCIDTERTVNARKGKKKRKATDGACSMPQSDGEVVWAKAPGFRHR